MGLTGAKDWNVQTSEANESLTLTMVRAEAQGIVTLVWRINTTSAEVKYDLKVDNWRWATNSTGHRLVLDMLVVGKNLRNETGARVTVEDAGYISWASTGTVTYPDGTTATANVTAERKGDDDKEGKDDEGETGAHLLLAFDAAPGYSGLDYDPTFGVQSAGTESRGVPGPAPVMVVGVLAVAAVVAMRRRRS
jgi:MYXO-CTERM domain-containing protein